MVELGMCSCWGVSGYPQHIKKTNAMTENTCTANWLTTMSHRVLARFHSKLPMKTLRSCQTPEKPRCMIWNNMVWASMWLGQDIPGMHWTTAGEYPANLKNTAWKIDMSPKKGPFQKDLKGNESSSSPINFQGTFVSFQGVNPIDS